MSLRRALTLLASLAITIIFLALALNSVDFGKLARTFAAADYRLVLLGGCFTFGGYLLRTRRWERLLAPTRRVPLGRLFPVLVVGFALNNLLPGRPGEFVRPFALGKREQLSKTLGFATIVVERVADGLALVAFLLLALVAFAPLRIDLPPLAEAIGAAATVVFGIALVVLLFLLVREQQALAIFQRVARILPRRIAARLETMLGSFTLGLHSLRTVADVAVIALLSVSVWACESVSYFLVLSAFGALPSLPARAVAAVFMMVLINLGIMIPAAPGGLGPFEAAGVFALASFGLDETTAASVALTAHTVQYLLITMMGLVFVWREGISLAQANAEMD